MQLYNTLTRKKEPLTTLEPGKIRLYTCGLTVYSQPHIGNWLSYIYWDILVRTLQAEGYEVTRTQNITDVGHLVSDDDEGEDKMEKGARKEGLTAWDVADKYIHIAATEAAQLRLTPPDHLVRATDYIQQQIDFARQLDEKGYLYKTADGMYFDTSKLSDYGKLARLDTGGLQAGTRVDIAGKKHPTDFAVWKFSPKSQQRDMEWDSPWGIGFPGWHLECSVIARETLGDQIDIHTGGIDHIPVHHTNEIAQTEALAGKQFSTFWLHANHIKADGQKMSKSLGNIYTLQDITDRGYSLNAFRMFALSKHYRTEGNFTWENLEAAANRLQHWREIAALVHQPVGDVPHTQGIIASDVRSHVMTALENDLDTISALQAIEVALDQYGQSGVYAQDVADFQEILQLADDLLGLQLAVEDITPAQRQLITQRQAARAAKNWPESDRLRDELLTDGIAVRDTPHGAIWSRI